MRRPIRLAVALALLVAAPVFAESAPDPAAAVPSFAAEPVTGETVVRVEKLKPKRPKHESLRFLKANRDFIRLCLDRTREQAEQRPASPLAVDARFLDYPRLLAGVLAARDSVLLADEALRRRELFESITQLGQLEAQLDQLGRMLADQRARMGVLQANFTGQQRTALLIVASGYPTGTSVERVSVQIDEGDTLTIALSEVERLALERGAAVQLFHGFAEPREQDVRVALGGASWPAEDAGWVRLEPVRDRLTVLRLDLSRVQPSTGASGIRAGTWLHDARPDGSGS
jgi:hypothetical protein